MSRAIRLGTCSAVSHVGMVVHDTEVSAARDAMFWNVQYRARFLLVEATTLNGMPCVITGKVIRGVQAHDPRRRVRLYDGRVWLYQMTPEWQAAVTHSGELRRMRGDLLKAIGTEYDAPGALLAGTRLLKHLWPWGRGRRPNLFCNELLCGVLQRSGMFPLRNPSTTTPASMLRQLVRSNVYLPGKLIKG